MTDQSGSTRSGSFDLSPGAAYWTIFHNRDESGNRPLVLPWRGVIVNYSAITEGNYGLVSDDGLIRLHIPHKNSCSYLLFATRDEAEAKWAELEASELAELEAELAVRRKRLTDLSSSMARGYSNNGRTNTTTGPDHRDRPIKLNDKKLF